MITFDEFGFVLEPGERLPSALKERVDLMTKGITDRTINVIRVETNRSGFVTVLIQIGDRQ